MKVVKKMVQYILMESFGFSEIFAVWLPNHLEHLNQGSRIILMNLKD